MSSPSKDVSSSSTSLQRALDQVKQETVSDVESQDMIVQSTVVESTFGSSLESVQTGIEEALSTNQNEGAGDGDIENPTAATEANAHGGSHQKGLRGTPQPPTIPEEYDEDDEEKGQLKGEEQEPTKATSDEGGASRSFVEAAALSRKLSRENFVAPDDLPTSRQLSERDGR